MKKLWEILSEGNWSEDGIKRMEDAFRFLCSLKEKLSKEDIEELSYLLDVYNA